VLTDFVLRTTALEQERRAVDEQWRAVEKAREKRK
jgi:hypothetical protein